MKNPELWEKMEHWERKGMGQTEEFWERMENYATENCGRDGIMGGYETLGEVGICREDMGL